MNKELEQALSDQINAENYSAYLYLSMSTAADQMGLKGTAHWLFLQAQEEMAHGTNIYQYMLERGAAPVLGAIDKPDADFSDVGQMFKKVLEHEQYVTERINAIASLALSHHDHAAYQFMLWYVNEQVEEEASASEVLDKLRLIGDNQGLLLGLDQELGARVFVNPFPNQG